MRSDITDHNTYLSQIKQKNRDDKLTQRQSELQDEVGVGNDRSGFSRIFTEKQNLVWEGLGEERGRKVV